VIIASLATIAVPVVMWIVCKPDAVEFRRGLSGGFRLEDFKKTSDSWEAGYMVGVGSAFLGGFCIFLAIVSLWIWAKYP
jgi:hypothetical protein